MISIDIPTNVLIALTASAPPDSEAIAISSILVTLKCISLSNLNSSSCFVISIQNLYFIIRYLSLYDSIKLSDSEIRRVVFVDGGEIYLDVPIAFPHADSSVVKQIDTTASGVAADIASGLQTPSKSAASTTSYDKLITWVPGVYDTIDTPDPQEAMEARYMLGQNTKRNAYQIFKGQQTFSGSVGGMVLLNGITE